jgi:hypothetical protein
MAALFLEPTPLSHAAVTKVKSTKVDKSLWVPGSGKTRGILPFAKNARDGSPGQKDFTVSKPLRAEDIFSVNDFVLDQPPPSNLAIQLQLCVKNNIQHTRLEVGVCRVFPFDEELSQTEEMPNAICDLFDIVEHVFSGSKKLGKYWLGVKGCSVAKYPHQIQLSLNGCSIKCDPFLVLRKHLFPEWKDVQSASVDNSREPRYRSGTKCLPDNLVV